LVDDSADNCPNVADEDQLDRGGIDTATPEGSATRASAATSPATGS